MLYVLIIIFLIFLSYLYDYRGIRKYKSTSYNITMWIFILLAGLRYRIGSDTIIYEYAFEQMPVIWDLTIHYIMDVSRFECGFTVLMSLVKTVFHQFWVFLLIQSIITNYCVFKFFKDNTSAPYVAVLAYFIVLYYYINCEAARQGLAVGVILFSWKYFANNQWAKYILAVIVASLFHISAIFFIILPLLKLFHLWGSIKPSPFMYIFLIGILFSSMMIGRSFSNYLVLLELSGRIEGQIDAYYSYGDEIGHLSTTSIVAYLFSYVLMPSLFLSKRKLCNSTFGMVMVPMILFSCMVGLCGGIPMTYRIMYYMLPFYFVGISDSLFRKQVRTTDNLRKSDSSRPDIVLMLMLAIFFVYKSRAYFVEESNSQYYKYYMRFYPYNSIIDKGIDPNREALYRK